MVFLPVRCTCGKVIASKQKTIESIVDQLVQIGWKSSDALDEALNQVGFNRYCCRLAVKAPANIIDPGPENTRAIYGLPPKVLSTSGSDNNNRYGTNMNDLEIEEYELYGIPGPTNKVDEEGNRLIHVGGGYLVPVLKRRYGDTEWKPKQDPMDYAPNQAQGNVNNPLETI